ncbi:MAG: hypothetical protein ACK502_06070 [Alphaproteobacteria bacterium]
MDAKPTNNTSKAEMDFWSEWADKAPEILRANVQKMMLEFNAMPPYGNPYKTAGVTLGAVLGAATLTKWVRGGWKWATGATAVGSLAVGLYMGKKLDEVVCLGQHLMPELFKKINAFADVLEKDPELRKQLADYLSTHVTAKDIQSRGVEEAVTGKTIEFGATTPYLDSQTLSKHVLQQMKENGSSCNIR